MLHRALPTDAQAQLPLLLTRLGLWLLHAPVTWSGFDHGFFSMWLHRAVTLGCFVAETYIPAIYMEAAFAEAGATATPV